MTIIDCHALNKVENSINLEGSGLIYKSKEHKYEQLSEEKIMKIRGDKY